MTLPKTCVCGRRVEPGARCPCTQPKPVPAYKKRYASQTYRKNRIERYMLVGGLCEACGAVLKGPLHDEGRAWQSHHVMPLPQGDDSVANLRVCCTRCHSGARKPR